MGWRMGWHMGWCTAACSSLSSQPIGSCMPSPPGSERTIARQVVLKNNAIPPLNHHCLPAGAKRKGGKAGGKAAVDPIAKSEAEAASFSAEECLPYQ